VLARDNFGKTFTTSQDHQDHGSEFFREHRASNFFYLKPPKKKYTRLRKKFRDIVAEEQVQGLGHREPKAAIAAVAQHKEVLAEFVQFPIGKTNVEFLPSRRRSRAARVPSRKGRCGVQPIAPELDHQQLVLGDHFTGSNQQVTGQPRRISVCSAKSSLGHLSFRKNMAWANLLESGVLGIHRLPKVGDAGRGLRGRW